MRPHAVKREIVRLEQFLAKMKMMYPDLTFEDQHKRLADLKRAYQEAE